MRAQGETKLFDRRELVRDLVQSGMECRRADPHRLVQEVFFPLDVRVERALLHAKGLGDVADRRTVIALLGE
jgi:hypothetical protein